MQIVAYILGLVAIFFSTWRFQKYDRLISGILAFFWVWIGLVYHYRYFSEINSAAGLFGGLFVLQGLLFFYFGVMRNRLSFAFTRDVYSVTGAIFILYAIAVYPVLSRMLGNAWPETPAFGLTPCPAVIFTFGLLLAADRQFPKWIIVIPLLWSLIGFSAAVNLGMIADYGLVAAGIIGSVMIFLKKPKYKELE